MAKNLHHHLKKRTISLAKTWASLLIVLFVLIVLAAVSMLSASRRYRQDEIRELEERTVAMAGDVDAMLDTITQVGNTVAYSSVCQKYLLLENLEAAHAARRDADELLAYVASQWEVMNRFGIFSRNGRFLSCGDDMLEKRNILQDAMEQAGLNADLHMDSAAFIPVETDDGTVMVYLAPVLGQIDGFRYWDNIMVYGIILEPGDFAPILSGDVEEGEAVLSFQTEPFSADGDSKENSNVYSQDLSLRHADWTLTTTYPISNGSRMLGILQNSSPIMILLIVVLLIAVIAVVFMAFSHSIKEMTRGIEAAEREGTDVASPGITEFQPITEEINRSFAHLREAKVRETALLQESYESRLASVQAELLAYRTQINPHFLFNTLETARSMARHFKAGPLEDLISNMSGMFHYSLYSSMMTTLSAELAQIDRYLEIMNIRFPNRFTVVQDIDPDTLDWPVITMLIEPIIENITQHAFKGRPKGTIKIRTSIEEDRLHIRIEDDGIGIPQEKLDAVVQNMKRRDQETFVPVSSQEEDRSIGLANIYRRLKLTFGDHAHLDIVSEEGTGTCVDLRIPAAAEPLG